MEAEIAALEAAVVAAVTAGLAAQVARIAGVLRDAVHLAVTDPAQWRATRVRAARGLRRIRPDVARQVARLLPRAARLGARQAGGALPDSHVPGGDDLNRQALDTVDRDTAGRLARAADQLVDGRVDTLAQLEHVLDRADAAVSHAGTVAGDAAAREVAAGLRATAAEQGMDLVIVAERDACLSCQSMAGATTTADGGMFRPVRVYTNRLMPWLRDGVETVPLHRRCRCRVAVATPGLADGLRREAERSVARGQSAYDSLPARLRAVDRVLAAPGSSRLPKSVRDRAARDRARGEFSRRDQRPARKAG